MTSNAIKILICGSEKFQLGLIEDELTRSFRNLYLAMVDNIKQALCAVGNDRFDFIIVAVDDEAQIESIFKIKEIAFTSLIMVLTDKPAQALADNNVVILEKSTSVHQDIPEIIREKLKAKLRQYRLELQEHQKIGSQSSSELIKITTGTLSHQVNNPLMTILGLTELILEENNAQDEELTRRIEIIRNSAQQIQNSLKNLSEISKPSIRQTVSGPMLVTDRVELEPQID